VLVLLLFATLTAPRFETAFWSHWGDGKAELSGYELTMPRYGQPRQGTAVAIFVTEDFSEELRVKADPGQHEGSRVYPVLKLNLVEDFATGLYDYNLMTSAFVALAAHAGRPAGSTSKISFSSQEWCGHVYQQMLFHKDRVELTAHSYFDGEADRKETLRLGGPTLAEDALLIWARGLAWPQVGPGDSAHVAMLRSAKRMRLLHRDAETVEVALERSAEIVRVRAAGAEHDARLAQVRSAGGELLAQFWVETAPPQRILRWELASGESAELIRSVRLPYWQLNGPGGERQLELLGLSPRPARTP
jgi:hypothetical protein